jgi:hypothetical protein
MIFSNCRKLFVTNKSVALTSLLKLKPNLVNGCFFLTFATQNKNAICQEDGKAVRISIYLSF